MQPKQLSKADSQVLAQVFDPESGPTRAEVVVNPDLPIDRHISDNKILENIKYREKKAIAVIEQCEKSGDTSNSKAEAYREAMSILDGLISDHPNYASAKNNRAQLRRWRYGDRNTLCQKAIMDPQRAAAGVDVVRDLCSAINLASPKRQQDAVSPAQGQLLAQSYTQLAALYYAASKDLDSSSIVETADFNGACWSKDRFEEEASRLFYLGGVYGNEVAKALAVHTNPHAKLCGSIVKEAMRKELAGVCD